MYFTEYCTEREKHDFFYEYRKDGSTSVVDFCDHMADWELGLPATTAQHHERESYCISFSLRKDQNLKFEVLLSHHCKVKKII